MDSNKNINKNKNTDSFTVAEDLAIKLRISLQINFLEDQIEQFKNSSNYKISERNKKFLEIISTLQNGSWINALA